MSTRRRHKVCVGRCPRSSRSGSSAADLRGYLVGSAGVFWASLFLQPVFQPSLQLLPDHHPLPGPQPYLPRVVVLGSLGTSCTTCTLFIPGVSYFHPKPHYWLLFLFNFFIYIYYLNTCHIKIHIFSIIFSRI